MRRNTHFIEVYDEKIYLPSLTLHAVLILSHLISDFAGVDITILQISSLTRECVENMLCYNESLSEAFWSGVKNHLRKPKTI